MWQFGTNVLIVNDFVLVFFVEFDCDFIESEVRRELLDQFHLQGIDGRFPPKVSLFDVEIVNFLISRLQPFVQI